MFNRLSTPAATPSASPPPPANRGYSPGPRRLSHLGPGSAAQRPGFSPRSSSLSVHSNDSTASLLASSRRPNGSGLKQSITVPKGPEPLEVLEKLLRFEGKDSSEISQPDAVVNGHKTEEDDFDEGELDFEGLSLCELASQKSPFAKNENVYTSQSVEECMFCSCQTVHTH
jgi:hypothetical protein